MERFIIFFIIFFLYGTLFSRNKVLGIFFSLFFFLCKFYIILGGL